MRLGHLLVQPARNLESHHELADGAFQRMTLSQGKRQGNSRHFTCVLLLLHLLINFVEVLGYCESSTLWRTSTVIRKFIATNFLDWPVLTNRALRMLLDMLEVKLWAQAHFAGNFMISLLQSCVALEFTAELACQHCAI